MRCPWGTSLHKQPQFFMPHMIVDTLRSSNLPISAYPYFHWTVPLQPLNIKMHALLTHLLEKALYTSIQRIYETFPVVSEVILFVKIFVFQFLVCYSMSNSNWPLFNFYCHLEPFEIKKTLYVMVEYCIKSIPTENCISGRNINLLPGQPSCWPSLTSRDLWWLKWSKTIIQYYFQA